MMNIDIIDQVAFNTTLSADMLTYLKHNAVSQVIANIAHKDHPNDEYDAAEAIFNWLDHDGQICLGEGFNFLPDYQKATGYEFSYYEEYEEHSYPEIIQEIMEIFDTLCCNTQSILAIQQIEQSRK